MSFSISATTTLTIPERIAVELNHQNFSGALALLDQVPLTNTGLESMNYFAALTYANVKAYQGTGMQDFLDRYLMVHPEVENRSAFLTRYDRGVTRVCAGEKVLSLSDTIDKGFCVLFSDRYTNAVKRANLFTIIKRGESRIKGVTQIERLQYRSDLLNLIGHSIARIEAAFSPAELKSLKSTRKKLSESLLKEDPSFINGYLGLLSVTDPKDCRAMRSIDIEMRKNFRGDEAARQKYLDGILSEALRYCITK